MRLFLIWAVPIAVMYLAAAFVVLDFAWAFEPDNIDAMVFFAGLSVAWAGILVELSAPR